MTEESVASPDVNLLGNQVSKKGQMSFADNLPVAAKMQVTSVAQKGQNSDSEDDEEGIASPGSSSSSDSVTHEEKKQASKAKLEESVRSSRTANFIPS